MRLKGYSRAYVIGDITSLSNRVFDNAKRQTAVFKQVLIAGLPCTSNSDLALATENINVDFTVIDPLEKKFGISLGRYAGCGYKNGQRVPSAVVGITKSKNMVPKGTKLVSGKITV